MKTDSYGPKKAELGRVSRTLDAELREKFTQFLDNCRRLIERDEVKEAADEDLKIVAAHLARREENGS